MPRWAKYGQAETQVLTEGDRRFNGLDMTRDRSLLEPGILALSQNKRLNNGIAATRGGCIKLDDLNPPFTTYLVGSGVFSNPNGDEMLLVGEQGANFVWGLVFGKDPLKIQIDSGTLDSGHESGKLDGWRVRFVQVFDHVYCLRAPSNPPYQPHSTLIWDGNTTDSDNDGIVDSTFTPVTQQTAFGTGDIMIPGGVDPGYPNQTWGDRTDYTAKDGVTASGSPTFTSASTTFVNSPAPIGDIGKTLICKSLADDPHTDGQCSVGDAQLGSPSTTFVASDVGLTIVGTYIPAGTIIVQAPADSTHPHACFMSNNANGTSSTGFPFTIQRRFQAIPDNTTILSVTGTHTVTLSNNANAIGTNLVFTIAGRTIGPSTFTTWNGEPFQDRILLYEEGQVTKDWRDTFIMTETLLWDQYNEATGTWRINAGESNIITRVMGYYRGSVLIFFRRGIHILENFMNPPPAPGGQVGDQRMVNNFLGLVSSDAASQVGVDVYFLSEPGKGIYRVSEAVQDQIAVNPLAVSDPIQPIIDQINWQVATYLASMKTMGPYVFLGVPVNTSSFGNNTVCVYNQYTRQWESIDAFSDPNFFFQEMHVISCGGVRQLICVDWYRKQIIQMYQEGLIYDQIGPSGAPYPINDIIETRGYSLGDPTGFKRYLRTCLAIKTFDPQIDLTSLTDGYGASLTGEREGFESKLLNDEPILKDRLKTYIHGQEFFDPAVGDPNQTKREDYSFGAVDFPVEDFEALPVGPIATWPGKNVSLYNGEKQQTLERYSIRQNGRWSSMRVDNSKGNCDVLAVSVDGIPVQEGVHLVA